MRHYSSPHESTCQTRWLEAQQFLQRSTKRRRRKFEPRVRVWKLKEEKICEEFRCMVGDKVEAVKWKGLGLNDHWQQMKDIMMETAQDICGMTKGPHRQLQDSATSDSNSTRLCDAAGADLGGD